MAVIVLNSVSDSTKVADVEQIGLDIEEPTISLTCST